MARTGNCSRKKAGEGGGRRNRSRAGSSRGVLRAVLRALCLVQSSHHVSTGNRVSFKPERNDPPFNRCTAPSCSHKQTFNSVLAVAPDQLPCKPLFCVAIKLRLRNPSPASLCSPDGCEIPP
eukprot:3185781-Rhodomonas_salina.2